MIFKPTPDDGREVTGDSPFGAFYVRWDRTGELAEQSIDIRRPTPSEADPIRSEPIHKAAPGWIGVGDLIHRLLQTCRPCSRRRAWLNAKTPKLVGRGLYRLARWWGGRRRAKSERRRAIMRG